jgi:formylglycine-generating enzyme required for sulfatase activity
MRDPKFQDIFTSFIPFFIFFFLFLPAVPLRAAGQKPETAKNAPGKTETAQKQPIPPGPRSIEQVFIPPGTVTLGSDKAEKAYAYSIGGPWAKKWRWFDVEKRRRVFVGDFYIDKYPVTEAQYAKFVRATGHRAPYISRDEYQRQGFLVHPYEEVVPYLWHETKDGPAPPPDRLDHPVVLVSVDDASAYCSWRGRFDPGRAFALPTEDHWEKAARGTDGRYFPWGNRWDPSRANIGATGPGGTTPVDRYPSGKSPYGVFEMAGNIFEWTSTPAKDDPERHILKSCSWDDLPGICRGAARHSRQETSRHILIGFRCVSTPKKK